MVQIHPVEREYEAKMKLMSNCCSYLGHAFESHPGIKFAKLEAHVMKYGLRKKIEYMAVRAFGTSKSHKFTESFKKSSRWY